MNMFDIIGPVMIGPSSSHTAGAVRIGAVARSLLDGNPEEVEFVLHDVFAKTAAGHRTYEALVGGLVGLDISDPELMNSFALARAQKTRVSFRTENLGIVHPNTVKIYLTGNGKKRNITASSVGGGRIEVIGIDDMRVSFTTEFDTLIVLHNDKPGVIAELSSLLYKHAINIAFMRVFRRGKGSIVVTVIETDEKLPAECLRMVSSNEKILQAVAVPKWTGGIL